MQSFLSSGELARRAGVSVDTLRHYERKRVLPAAARRTNSYREWPVEAVKRVVIIRRALTIGFTLDELSRLFAMRARGEPPCRMVSSLAREKLADVDVRIAELTDLREHLRAVIADWDRRLAATALGQPAHLLESLHDVQIATETKRIRRKQ